MRQAQLLSLTSMPQQMLSPALSETVSNLFFVLAKLHFRLKKNTSQKVNLHSFYMNESKVKIMVLQYINSNISKF